MTIRWFAENNNDVIIISCELSRTMKYARQYNNYTYEFNYIISPKVTYGKIVSLDRLLGFNRKSFFPNPKSLLYSEYISYISSAHKSGNIGTVNHRIGL